MQRVSVLIQEEQRAKECSTELASLRETHIDTFAQLESVKRDLEAVRKEKAMVDAQGQQVCRAVFVSVFVSVFVFVFGLCVRSVYECRMHLSRVCVLFG